jgi:hypothetical protein
VEIVKYHLGEQGFHQMLRRQKTRKKEKHKCRKFRRHQDKREILTKNTRQGHNRNHCKGGGKD